MPTQKGLKNYPDTNGTYEGIPCECTDNCPFCCKGSCGCKACAACYGDVLTMDREEREVEPRCGDADIASQISNGNV